MPQGLVDKGAISQKILTMPMVYIAGPYSAPDPIQMFHNIKAGIRVFVSLLLRGSAPFCPFLDFQALICELGKQIDIDRLYNYSLAMLTRADAVYLLDGWENSVGATREVELAKQLQITTTTELLDFTNSDNWPNRSLAMSLVPHAWRRLTWNLYEGAHKHGIKGKWGNNPQKYDDKLMRHREKRESGKITDKEGIYHGPAVAWNALVVEELRIKKKARE